MFFEAAGWERPHWYESNAPLLEEYGDRVTRREAEWDSRWWSPIINAEHLAMRDRAGMVDLSAFAIFDIAGPGALAAVQGVSVRQMDVSVGRVVYTPILSPGGGFKADLTIMRLGEELFRVVTGGAHGAADKKWFTRPPPGRRERAALRRHDRLDDARPVGPAGPRHPRVGHARRRVARRLPVRAPAATSRSTRCACSRRGSPTSATWAGSSTSRWSRVRSCGTSCGRPARAHGAAPVGIGVYGTTGRLEKCYRAYGFELETEYNVVEAGMSGPKVKDDDFVGRDAHLRHREEEPATTLCTLTVDDHTSASGVKRYMLGREPIMTRSGEPLVDRKGRGPT